MQYHSLLLLAASGLSTLTLASPVAQPKVQLFADASNTITEAAPDSKLALSHNPKANVFHSPARSRYFNHSKKKGPKHPVKPKPGAGKEIVNTIFSGIYPTVNLTWVSKTGATQKFVSFIDTGSADTFVVGKNFTCVDIPTMTPRDQAACGFGPLYNSDGTFVPNGQTLNISYFPENEALRGKFGYHPLQLGGITVPKQQVAIVDYAAWEGDYISSGLIGFGYPAITSAFAPNGSSVEYDPIFTTMVKQNLVKKDVFSLAIDRVPRGTPVSANAGQLALGGLVDPKYYKPPFTTVPIEETKGISGELSWYTTTHDFIYGKTASTATSASSAGAAKNTTKTLRFQSIIDSGTAPNFIPTAAAEDLNSLFEPAATYNDTLGYWTVDCNAKAPYAAYKIGNTVFPMDPRDMIVRSLNGLPGYDNVCFSAFGDGGEDGPDVSFLIGSVWMRSVVVVHDVGRTQLHIAPRRPY